MYREVEIRGSLLTRFLPKGTPYGFGNNFVSGACTVAADVVGQIDAAQAAGVRRLLLVVDCFPTA